MRKRIVFLFALLWGASSPTYALSAASLITRARLMLRDTSTDTTRQKFSDAQLLAWLNDGQREANSFSWVLRGNTSISLAGGATEYVLPSDFMATWRVEFSNQKLDQTSWNELDADRPGWRTTTGKPSKYWLRFSSVTLMGFYPAPVSSSTGTVTVDYIQEPTDITDTADSPWNNWEVLSPYHASLAYYMAFRGFGVLQDAPMAQQYFQEWQLYIEGMRTGLLKMPDYNPGMRGRRSE